MAKTKGESVKWAEEFERTIVSPNGLKERAIKVAFGIVMFPLIPLYKIYPFSLGADYGRISRIKKNEGFRKAVEFGNERLRKYVLKVKSRPVFKAFNGLNRQMVWMLLAKTIDYAYWDPKAEDEVAFREFVDALGIDSEGRSPSETFCALARLTWVLGKREEPWEWIERAVKADAQNADAHYLKGWFEIQLDRGNPVESLFTAVSKDPDLLRKMRKDEALIRFPDFISAVDARARQAGIYVV